MRYIEDLIPLRLYSANKKVWAPHDPKDRKRNAAVYLLGRTIESSTKLMNLPYIYNPNLFTSYYMNRDIDAYVNHEGALIRSIEENIGYDAIREGFYHGNEHHVKINIIGDYAHDANEVRIIKKICNETTLAEYRKVINVDVTDDINVVVYNSVAALRAKAPKLYKNSNSYTVANNIHILLPSAYKADSMDGKYSVYVGHEIAMLMIYKINSKCNPVLAEYIAGYACGQTKLEDDYLYKNGLDVSGSKVIEKIVARYGSNKINTIIRHNDIGFVSDFASRGFVKNVVSKLSEAGMSTAERNGLPDSEFGIPSERKYPLNDESHVRYAIKLFGHVDRKHEKQLATAIKRKIKQYDMDVKIGSDNKLSKYINEGAEIAYLPIGEAEEVILPRMKSGNAIAAGGVEAAKTQISAMPDENLKALLMAELDGYSTLNKSTEDSMAKTTPEDVDKDAIKKLLDQSTSIVESYKQYQMVNLDWILKHAEESGNMREKTIAIVYEEYKAGGIADADIRNYILEVYFDDETDPEVIKQSLRMRLAYVQQMESIYTEMLKVNYQLFGFTMQEANDLLAKNDGSIVIKAIKKAIDADPSKFVVKNGCVNYKAIGGGVLFTAENPEDLANLVSIAKTSHYINLSMEYDCIIATHGGSAPSEKDPSKNTWIIDPPVYTLTNGPFNNMYELVKQCIFDGYKNILLYSCNPGAHSINDDPMIAKSHVKITYATNILNAESASISDPVINTLNESKADVLNICNEYGIDYDDDYTLYESYKFVEKNKEIVTEGIGATVWNGLKNFVKKVIEALVYMFKAVINAFKTVYNKIKGLIKGKEKDEIKELTTPIIMKENVGVKEIKVHSVAELEKYFVSSCQAITDEMKAFQNKQMQLVKKTEAIIDKRAKASESSTNESSVALIGDPSKHRFMYHLVPKGTDVSQGIVSPYFLKKEKRYDELDKLLDTYRDKLCGIWGRYPDSYPADLSREDILIGLKDHRGIHGDKMISMFAFPPKTELSYANMAHILKTNDVYRIDIGNIPDDEIADMRWGNVTSQLDSIAKPDEMFDRMKIDGYYTDMYDDDGQLIYKSLTHLGLAMKTGMIEPKYFEKILIPENLTMYTEGNSIKESCKAPLLTYEEHARLDANGYIMTEDYMRVKNEGYDNIFYFNEAEDSEDDFVDDESDTSYNALIRRYLYRNRIKNNKELLNVYDKVTSANPWIRRTYLKLAMYKRQNLIVDLSYYHNQFLNNITYKMDKAVNMYWDFLNRLMDNAEIDSQYGIKTYLIPIDIEDWNVSSTDLWDYKKSLNPISAIFRLVRTNPSAIKQKWGNKRILFCSARGYFTINFAELEIKSLARIKMNIAKLHSMEEIDDGPDEEDETPDASETSDIVSSIEKSKSIDMTTKTIVDKKPIVTTSKDKNPAEEEEDKDLVLIHAPIDKMVKGNSQITIISASDTSTRKLLNSSYFKNKRSIKKIIKGK